GQHSHGQHRGKPRNLLRQPDQSDRWGDDQRCPGGRHDRRCPATRAMLRRGRAAYSLRFAAADRRGFSGGLRRERMMRVLNYCLCAVASLVLAPATAVALDEATIISNPAEKYAIGPGGVDMRTGQYVYTETDLQVGPKDGGLALTRTTPVYVQ